MVENSKTKKVWNKIANMNISYNFTLGPINAENLLTDPKHFSFVLSRYKFAAKMLKGCNHIIEIGCGEGIGALMLLNETKAKVTAIDFDGSQIQYAQNSILPHFDGRVDFICQDLILTPYKRKKADGAVCLDVIEHLYPKEEEKFFENYVSMLKDKAISIIGTPNQFAKQYGSKRSKEGHINLFTPKRLKVTLDDYFTRTFLFSMNDEVVHTGYDKMAHYLIALSIK